MGVSKGKAIMITSMTTMIVIGILLLVKYRGMGSMGLLLVPAILGWIERRKKQD